MRLRSAFVLLTVAAFGLSLLLAQPAAGPGFDPDRYLEHIKYLADEEMQGRGAATPQLDRAASYIRRQFRQIGLDPLDGYFQEFDVATGARLGNGNRFEYSLGDEKNELTLKRQFIPLKLSGRSRASGSVVFAGYGISAPEYGYDDFAGIDAAGKIVLMLRHEPQEYDRTSMFAGRVYTEHSQLFAKVLNAQRHGAAAVLLVNDTEQHGGASGDLTTFDSYPGSSGGGIPFVHLNSDVAARWFEAAGRDFVNIQREINDSLTPASFAFPESLSVAIRTNVQRKLKPVRNVVGYLPGHTSEYVIIGAHYDHIGHGEQYSLSPASSGVIHPGADDNASGVAALIELARYLTERPKSRRGVLFLAFAAEELGLVGSGHYVRSPRLPLSDAVAMINMDMIGRMRDDRLYVGGATTGDGLTAILEGLNQTAGLDLDLSETVGYGSSDHTSFMARQIPALFFFSGLHGDYHRPGDTWEKIKPEQAVRVMDYIASLTSRLVDQPARPSFVKPVDIVPGTH